jgi:hypothetical protein
MRPRCTRSLLGGRAAGLPRRERHTLVAAVDQIARRRARLVGGHLPVHPLNALGCRWWRQWCRRWRRRSNWLRAFDDYRHPLLRIMARIAARNRGGWSKRRPYATCLLLQICEPSRSQPMFSTVLQSGGHFQVGRRTDSRVNNGAAQHCQLTWCQWVILRTPNCPEASHSTGFLALAKRQNSRGNIFLALLVCSEAGGTAACWRSEASKADASNG